MKKKEKLKKVPGLGLALIPIVSMIFLLGLGYGFFGIGPQVLMLIAASIAGIIAVICGYTWDDIINNIVSKISKTMPAIMILIVVGFLIGTWMTGGTIPMLIFYGLKIISPNFIVVTAFVVTAFISLCTGTSWGSVGTIGVAIMGVAMTMKAPLPIVAGAVVSGAYFGDKISPLSDSTNLAPIAAGSELYEHIKHLLWTTLPGFIICLIVYTTVGLKLNLSASVNSNTVNGISTSLTQLFHFNILVVLPIIIVLGGAIIKWPTIPVMLGSSALAMFNAIVFQGFSITDTFESAVSGFSTDMLGKNVEVSASLATLLNRGGMISMLGVVLIAFCAYGFAGAMDVSGALNVVLKSLTKFVHSTGQLILTTVFSTILTVFVTSNGQLALLLPGEMFRDTFVKFGLEPKNLSRTIEDSGTVVEPITPWTAAGVYMATTLGVSTLSYLPWAILCYTGTIFALIYGFTGIGIAKITPKSRFYDEYIEMNNQDSFKK